MNNIKKTYLAIVNEENTFYINDIKQDEPDMSELFLIYKYPILRIERVDGTIMSKDEIIKLVNDFFWCVEFDDYVRLDVNIHGSYIEIEQNNDVKHWSKIDDIKESLITWMDNNNGQYKTIKKISNKIEIGQLIFESAERQILLADFYEGDEPSSEDFIKLIKSAKIEPPVIIYSTGPPPKTHEDEKELSKQKIKVITWFCFIEELNNDYFLQALYEYRDISAGYPPFNFQEYGDKLELVYEAKSNKEKKDTLEEFAGFIINSIPNLRVIEAPLRTKTEEIDLFVENESNDRFLRMVESPLAIECRNCEEKVDAPDARNFTNKIESLGIKSLVIFSKSGFTEPAFKIFREKRMKGQLIVPISGKMMKESLELNRHPILMFKEAFYSTFLF